MDMTYEEYDQAIWKITQREDYPCPDIFSAKMEMLYEGLPERGMAAGRWFCRKKTNRIQQHPYFRYGFIAAGVLCLLLINTPVSANLQGYCRRMAAMKNREKERYVSEVEKFHADGDRFSRALRASEWERLGALTETYEQEENFPVGQVTSIDSETEVQQGEIGFCAKNSTFYLPDSELTEEQLLEIIDFRHKREYSLAEKGEEDKKASDVGNNDRSDSRKLSREEAVAVGGEWIRRIYGKRVTGWESIVEETDSAQGGYHSITYRNEKTSAEYIVSICDADKKLCALQCVYNGEAENMSQGWSVGSKKIIKKRYREVKRLAAKLNDSKRIVSASCEYFTDRETGKLSLGCVSFRLKYKDQTALRVAYSLNSHEYYQFDYMGNEVKGSRNDSITDFKLAMKKDTIRLE